MGKKEELMASLKLWIAKLDNPAIKEQFKGFDKTLQFDFTDVTFHLLMVFKDQKCALKEGSVPNPDIVISTSSATILSITKGEIDPMKAFLGRKLAAKGQMQDMLKVQLLMRAK
jgi:putative sterol carrier protein